MHGDSDAETAKTMSTSGMAYSDCNLVRSPISGGIGPVKLLLNSCLFQCMHHRHHHFNPKTKTFEVESSPTE